MKKIHDPESIKQETGNSEEKAHCPTGDRTQVHPFGAQTTVKVNKFILFIIIDVFAQNL